MTKQEMLRQLERRASPDLDDLVKLIIKNCNEDGDPSKPIVNKAIVYSHGFVTA